MAVPLYGAAADLFPRLGRIGKVLLQLDTCQSGVKTTLDALIGTYAVGDEDLTAQLSLNRDAVNRGIPGQTMSYLTTLAASTLQRMVRDDSPTRGGSVTDALNYIIAQMKASSDSVQVCAVAVTPTVYSVQTGTGVVVVSTKRGDGLVLEDLFADTARLECTRDAVTGGAQAGNETFSYIGSPNAAGAYDWDWPQGSGATTNVSCADAGTDYSRGANVLVNGSFETWAVSAPYPTSWTGTGAVTQEASLVYAGASAVRVAAGQTPTLLQSFSTTGVTGGTRYGPPPAWSLAVALWVRGSASLSGGILKVELVDGTGAVVNDAQGNAQSVAIALTGLGTTYVPKTGVLRTPPVIPTSGLQIRLNVSTTPAGGDLLIDYFAASQLTPAYQGGPGLALFSGATRFVQGDGWNVASTNDRGGSSNLDTWQALMDRLFGMRGLGLLLPSSGSPTVADTLITS